MEIILYSNESLIVTLVFGLNDFNGKYSREEKIYDITKIGMLPENSKLKFVLPSTTTL